MYFFAWNSVLFPPFIFIIFCNWSLYIFLLQEGKEDAGNASENENSEIETDGALAEKKSGGVVNSDEDDEDQEWARFQNKLNKREKALEGRSRISHSVHCPYFTDDKQEYW